MFKIIKNIILISIVMFVAWFGLVKQDFIELNTAKGEHLMLVPMAQGKNFCMRFTHSVALTPVDECFIVDNTDIILKKTIYSDFGAGLPHAPEAGQKMVVEDGKIIISGYSLRIPSLQIRVGRIAKHRLLLPHYFTNEINKIYLETLVKPGEVVAVTAKQMTMMQAMTQHWATMHKKI